MSEGLNAGDIERTDWGMSEETQVALERDIAKSNGRLMLLQRSERHGQLDLLAEGKILNTLSRVAVQQEVLPQFS